MNQERNSQAPFDLPLSRDEFRRALETGHGRALMHARTFGINGLDDLLVEACGRTRVFDPQCEEGRAAWLVETIDAVGAEQWIVPMILDGFRRAKGENRFWDLLQLCSLAGIFAGRGHTNAREALYRAFGKNSDSLDLIGGEEIIDLDGADGFIHVAQTMGSWLEEEPGTALDDSPLEWYDERHGEGAAIRLLETAAGRDRRIDTYLAYLAGRSDGEQYEPAAGQGWKRVDSVSFDRESLDERRRTVRSMDASAVIRAVETTNPAEFRSEFSGWGREADEDDLRTIVARMFGETHPGRLARYLGVFAFRPLPQFDPRLLALADHPDEQVRRVAIRVLAHHEHPDVRTLALDRIGSGRIGEGELRLLSENHRPGDGRLVARALRAPADRDDLHFMVYDLVDGFEKNPTPESRDAMLFAYEQSPCSNCRRRAVDVLLSAGQAPGWLTRECEYDADEGVRKAASRAQE